MNINLLKKRDTDQPGIVQERYVRQTKQSGQWMVEQGILMEDTEDRGREM
jgi:hypothetical protein